MIEFKQIVGRGTRLFDCKEFFTIYDYVDAYHHFADPEWDGDAIECDVCGFVVCECPPKNTNTGGAKPCVDCGQSPCVCDKPASELCGECGEEPCSCKKRQKIKIKLKDGKEREI